MSATQSLDINAIRIDGGTQVRAAIDQQVVADYAEAMTAGAQFPPIVVFHDGNEYHLADGFHRVMAATRLQCRDMSADVRPGTREDALWFALGANRTNGKRLTELDKTHAIEMARVMWPAKMQREIAEQVGCHPTLVSKVYLKYQNATGSEPVLTGRLRKTTEKRATIKKLIEEGVTAKDIAERVGVSRTRVSEVRVALGLSRSIDRTRDGLQRRLGQMKKMAEEGHTSRQIATAVGMSEEGCRNTLKREGIDVPADKAMRGTRRHDSNRIVERMVMDAENLTEGVNLIDFADLDRARLAEWLRSLSQSRDKFGAFIRRLMKEQQSHGEAA